MSTSPLPGPCDCFEAQTIPANATNSDVGGVAVAISIIVINLTLPALLRWGSDSDVQTTIIMLLTQVYPILLATATSINTDNLSLFDAHFAIAATASPVSIYLVYSSFRDLIGLPNRLFEKLSQGKRTIRFLGLTLPVIWGSLNVLISFSPRAFRNSPQYCQKMTFLDWIQYQTLSNFVGILDIMGQRDLWNDLQGRGGLGTLSLITMWIWAIYTIHHRYDIYDEMRFRKQQQKERQKASMQTIVHTQKLGVRIFIRLKRALLFPLFNLISSSWFVITSSHPWTIFAIITFLHWSWILGLEKGMTIERYQLSYGQVLSLFSILPPLLAIVQLLHDRRRDFFAFVRNLWPSFTEGSQFLVTKSPNPWIRHWESDTQRKQFPRSSDFIFERYWLIVSLIWISTTIADVFWIIDYVEAGSRPTLRTPVNDPHKAWKPFSVLMYIYGYCLCYISILCWSLFYHEAAHNIPSPSLWLISAFRYYIKPSSWFNKHRKRQLMQIIRIVLVPVAFTACAGPLFAPFAALPLAQQRQWTHACDLFTGAVELRGITDPLQTPIAHFYYPANGIDIGKSIQFEYALVNSSTKAGLVQNLTYNGLFNPTSIPSLDVFSISYNLADLTFSVYCQPSSTDPCAIGNYTISPYLSFIIRDSDTGEEIRLRAQDKEWEFSNDAPNFILRFEDSGSHLNNINIQSAVTKRDHCEILKVCVSSGIPDSATLVPLGIVLMAQDVYSQYCLLPRLYTV